MEFHDLSFHPLADGGEPKGPHIFGSVVGSIFTPESDVVGALAEPPRGIVVRRGLLELTTRKVYREDDTPGPNPPYVPGYVNLEGGGGFFPSGPMVSITSSMVSGSSSP
jgi:hypothetical protein